MKKRSLFLLYLIMIPFTGQADEKGFYMGGDLGFAYYSGDGPEAQPSTPDFPGSVFLPGQKFSDTDLTFGIFAGFRLSDLLAAEFRYADLGSATDTFSVNPNLTFVQAPIDTQNANAKAYTISLLAGPHFTNGLSLFVEAGYSHMSYEIQSSGNNRTIEGSLTGLKSSDNGVVVGLGARYEISNRISARLQWRRHIIDRLDIDSATLGIEVGF